MGLACSGPERAGAQARVDRRSLEPQRTRAVVGIHADPGDGHRTGLLRALRGAECIPEARSGGRPVNPRTMEPSRIGEGPHLLAQNVLDELSAGLEVPFALF